MVGSNKILTVSYGTFSCTLEGFDESFDTMKSIAEYFRDLAADDRYFGAEPPTPDAEMLSRIAEREISRRVEARTEASGIVLRPAAALAAERGQAPETQAPNDTAATDVPVSTADAATEAAAQAEPPVEAPAQNNTVSSQEMTDSAAGRTPGSDVRTEPTPSGMLAASDPAVHMNRDDDQDDLSSPADSAATATADNGESVAAKLQRIRAVVGRKSATESESIFDEDLPNTALSDSVGQSAAPDLAPDLPPELEQEDDDLSRLSALSNMLETEDEQDVTLDPQSDLDEAADAASIAEPELPEESPEDDAAPEIDMDAIAAEPEAQAETEARAEAPAEDAPKAPSRSRIVRVKKNRVVRVERPAPVDATERDAPEIAPETPAQQASAEAPVENDDDHGINLSAIMNAGSAPQAPAPADDPAPQTPRNEADVQSTRAMISGLAALDGVDEFDDIDTDDIAELDPEEEAELLEELAEVEQDNVGLGDDLDQDVAEDEGEEPENLIVEDVTPEPRPRKNHLSGPVDEDESSVSRILSETDAQLREPEGKNRRQAIAHLKAAVAATEAARQLGEPEDSNADTEDAFREDLDQVVRPRRATRRDGSTQRPRSERPRPAPLKLVAAQRVDEAAAPAPAARDAGPVQPRRVAPVAVQPEPQEASGFADYAAEVGAHSLQDTLEAAAAYMACVEGAEFFSRPQLLRTARGALDSQPSREDELRSFGVLLRQGRIEKVRNGRFQISDQTRFRPEAQTG